MKEWKHYKIRQVKNSDRKYDRCSVFYSTVWHRILDMPLKMCTTFSRKPKTFCYQYDFVTLTTQAGTSWSNDVETTLYINVVYI